jgi:regulator of sigma E protease
VILVTVLVVTLVFGALVLVHELGHFIAAKRAGIRVDEFGFGFPPRVVGWKRGETLYSLNLIPLGGFVRLFGEDGEGRGEPGNFLTQPIGKRALVLVMGVAMNLVLAYVIITGLMFFKTPLYVGQASDYPGVKITSQSVVITDVESGSPANKAGIKAGDTVKMIDGTPVGDDQVARRILQSHANQTIGIVVKDQGQERSLTVHLRKNSSSGALGVGLGRSQSVRVPIWEVPIVAAVEEFRLIWLILVSIGGVFAGLIIHQTAPAGVAGPIGIVAVIQKVLELGIVPLLRLVVVLSLSLAVFNILPIPALDGGRLAFLGIEKISGHAVKTKVENAFHAAGFWLLLLLIGAISIYDVYRLTHHSLGL